LRLAVFKEIPQGSEQRIAFDLPVPVVLRIETVRFPQAVRIAFLFCAIAGRVAFLELNVPDDILF